MAAELPALLDPQDIRKRVGSHIEGQMTDENILDKRHVGRFVLAGANVNIRAPVITNHRGKAALCVDIGHDPSSGKRLASRYSLLQASRRGILAHNSHALRRPGENRAPNYSASS